MRLFLWPLRVIFCCHSVIRVIKRRAAMRPAVCSEHSCETAVSFAFWPLTDFEDRLGIWIPERASGGRRPVSGQTQLNVETLLSVRAGSGCHPENSDRPCWLLRQNIGASEVPESFQDTDTKISRQQIRLKQSLIGSLHRISPA